MRNEITLTSKSIDCDVQAKYPTLSLADLMGFTECIANNNKIPARDIPVLIKVGTDLYTVSDTTLYQGRVLGTYILVEAFETGKVSIVAKDERPDNADITSEYWDARIPSDDDVAGFVRSKRAGERIMNMVRIVLDKEETQTWLDYRKSEPTWIQLKFSAEEFDIGKLHDLSLDNNGIINIDMLHQCVK